MSNYDEIAVPNESMNNILLGDDGVVGPVLSADLDGFLTRSDTLVKLGLLEECSWIVDYGLKKHKRFRTH